MKPADVLDHATSEIVSGSKLGIDATKKLPGEGTSERFDGKLSLPFPRNSKAHGTIAIYRPVACFIDVSLNLARTRFTLSITAWRTICSGMAIWPRR